MSSSVDQGETFDAIDNPNVASSGSEPVVRTLKEPPDIWDMVHETHTEFKPGSAFIGRLTSSPLWLAAILLIIAGGAVFWFVRSRGSSISKTTATTVPAESRDLRVRSPSQTRPCHRRPGGDKHANQHHRK
jgi:hypothetical protein